MRIGNNVYGATEFYTKLSIELIDELRTRYLLGMGDEHRDIRVRTFRVELPTWRTKPGKKREKVKLSYDLNLSAYNFRSYKDIKPKNGSLQMWEINLW
ncbi:hypothetical protein PP754_gp017 [Pectobacterium phage Possum]|uniref:Uncharacterized protein n=1 Tax=Pectobacterium phage Possum TaxID=2686301 RepID=A0A7T0LVV2_9CAUD|nr:hypothetical protein PP754_gp017 [Pectobacterium phage Possum]QPL10858.1 hypothetical protein Possum_00017 [Pectobacterium phage Possum]QPL10960.1 hypothetical protein Horatius_00017 [Pectobacterium phage Horatius]